MRTGQTLFPLGIEPGISQIRHWKELFATRTQTTWLFWFLSCLMGFFYYEIVFQNNCQVFKKSHWKKLNKKLSQHAMSSIVHIQINTPHHHFCIINRLEDAKSKNVKDKYYLTLGKT